MGIFYGHLRGRLCPVEHHAAKGDELGDFENGAAGRGNEGRRLQSTFSGPATGSPLALGSMYYVTPYGVCNCFWCAMDGSIAQTLAASRFREKQSHGDARQVRRRCLGCKHHLDMEAGEPFCAIGCFNGLVVYIRLKPCRSP